MPFRILKIKFPKGAWRKPLFYINIDKNFFNLLFITENSEFKYVGIG